MGVPTKECTKCHKIFTIDNFYKSKRGLFGVRSDCKRCVYLRQHSIKIFDDPNLIKTCTRCHKQKLSIEFPTTNKISSGRKSQCIKCKRIEGCKYAAVHKRTNHRQYRKTLNGFKEKETRRNVKRRNKVNEFINSIKESTPCHDCNHKFPYYCMDFDHIDSSTKISSIKELKGTTLSKVNKEIKKCEVVCVNCHRLRTIRRIEKIGVDFFSDRPGKRHRSLIVKEKSKPCIDCNHKFHPAVMDFDHTRGEKIDTISKLINRFGKEKLLIEIAKCDVVCACCHRKRTFSRIVG